MRTVKRMLAVLLTLVMLIGLFPASALTPAYANTVHTHGSGMLFGGNSALISNKYRENSAATIYGLTSHLLSGEEVFCFDPTISSQSGVEYYSAGTGNNSSDSYWNSISTTDKRIIAAVTKYYAENPSASYLSSSDHDAALIAKLGAQYAIFLTVITAQDCERLAGRISATWDDMKQYAANALQYAYQNQNVPTVGTIAVPSFNGQSVELAYNDLDGVYEGSITDTNGALSNEGYSFAQSVNGVQVTQSGNTITITATPAAVAAAGLQDPDNSWSASATATKTVSDPINLNAISIYIRSGEQPLLWFDPSVGDSTVSGSQTATVRAHTAQVGTAQLLKTSTDPSVSDNNDCYSLQGAVYGVYGSVEDAENEVNTVTVLTTDSTGASDTVTLASGTYYAKELYAPPGFAMNTDVISFTVNSGSNTTISVFDKPGLDPVPILLQKIDAITGEPRPAGNMSLAGAEYTIKFYGGQYETAAEAESSGSPLRSWVVKTDEDGFADLGKTACFVSGDEFYYTETGEISFPLGSIVIYESKAPDGFLLDTTRYIVNITEDGTSSAVINSYNAPTVPEQPVTGSVTVRKVDAEQTSTQGNATLAGARFGLVNENNQSVTINDVETQPGEVALIIETDANGVATSAQVIPYGSYSLIEITPPTGYALNSTWSSGTFTISEDGQVIDAGTCGNVPLRGGVSVQKSDVTLGTTTPYGDASFANVTFNIYNASNASVIVNGTAYAPGDLVMQIVTDANGYATTGDGVLPYGLYRVIESSVTDGSGYSVNVNASTDVAVTGAGVYSAGNYPNIPDIYGGITVQKIDAGTGTSVPQGDATIAGAQFEIVNNSAYAVVVDNVSYGVGDVVATITTSANGIAASDVNLPMGTYTVREKTPSAGYTINNTWSQTVVIRENGTVYAISGDTACAETPIYGGIAVQKIDGATMSSTPSMAGTTLAGAVIGIVNESDWPVYVNGVRYENGEEVATITTDASGYAETADGILPYGTYSLYEKSAPVGYEPNNSWNPVVEVHSVQKYVLEGSDALVENPVSGSITVKKADADQNIAQGNATLSGAKFAVINENSYSILVNGNEIASQGIVMIIETDANGIASTGSVLPYGNYSVKEHEAPEGYNLNQQWNSGVLSIQSNGQNVDAGTCQDIVKRGGLSVQKVDSQLNTQTPHGGASFAGIVFDVYNASASDVMIGDNTYAAGEKVASITTDANGFATTGDNILPYGEYRIVESSVPASSGYARNENYEATVSVTGNGVVAAAPCANTINVFGGISVQKLDAGTRTTEAQGDASLAGAIFEIVNNSAYAVVVGGTTYAVGDVVGTMTTNESGVASFEANLPMGAYTVREQTPATGYTSNNSWSKTVSIRTNGEVCAIDGDNACEETPVYGAIAVQKLDGESMTATPRAGSTLAGTVIGIINESDGPVIVNGTRYENGDEVATITTNASGYAETADDFLPYGTYSLYEKSAPTGYELNSFWNPVVEVHSAQKYTLEGNDALVDNPVNGGIIVRKSDAEHATAQGSASLVGAKFAVINENDYSISFNGNEIEPQGIVMIIETNANGSASTGSVLPYGNYSVREYEAPAGYALNQEWSSGVLIVQSDGQTVDAGTCPNDVIRGGLSVQKVDSQLSTQTPYGDAFFAGIVFDIYNASDAAVMVNGTEYANGEKVMSITTDSTGFATTGNDVLPYGDYRVIESSVPASCGYARNENYEATVTVSGNAVVAVAPCENTADLFGGIRVQKVDSSTGTTETQGDASLEGASFEIVNSSAHAVVVGGTTYNVGDVVTTITTNASGIAVSEANLPMGTYTVTEKAPSVGYTNNSVWSQTVTIRTNGEIYSIEGDNACEETPVYGSLAVQKLDGETMTASPRAGSTLEGAVIGIINESDGPVYINGVRYESGDEIGTITTNASGYAETADGFIPYGTYSLYEKFAPTGYEKNNSWNPTVQVHSSQKYVLEGNEALVENPVSGGIVVRKADSVTGTAQGNGSISGAKFSVVNENDYNVIINGNEIEPQGTVMIIETNASGVASTGSVLPYGRYSVKEYEAPAGYTLNQEWSSGILSVQSNGQTVDAGTCPNDVIRGGMSVQKTDSQLDTETPYGDASFEGVVFDIYNASNAPVVVNGTEYAVGSKVVSITTNAAGFATTGENVLPYGEYRIVESSVPSNSGYALNEDYEATVTVSSNAVVAADPCGNTANASGGITVSKVDVSTGTAETQGDATLAGAQFEIINNSTYAVVINGVTYGAGEAVATITTNENGVAASEVNLPMGTYTVREKTASAGYTVNSSWSQSVVIRSNGEIIVLADDAACEEEPIYGAIAVQKLDGETMTATPRAGSTLAGAVIGIVNESDGPVYVDGVRYENGDEVATITTDANGYAETSDSFLPYGTYSLYEKAAPTGYELNSTWNPVVEIRSEQKQTLNGSNALVDSPISGSVTVKKVDADRTEVQGNASLAGAKFAVINENNYPIVVNGNEIAPQEIALIIETDASGIATSEKVLPFGQFSIREYEAPAGYELNLIWSSDVFVIETADQTVDAGICSDSVIRGGLSVQKTDSQLNTETPYGDASFEGVVFDIYNASNAPVVVNGVECAVGAKVASITTNAAGFAATGENVLPYGEYRIVESSVPSNSGYALNEDYEATVTVSSNAVAAAASCANTMNVLGGVSVQKVDAGTGTTEAQGDASLEGAAFEIVNSSAYTVVVGGTTYGVGEAVATITTNENGIASSEVNLPMGTYTIREKTASAGYTVNSNWSQTAVIRTNGEVVAIADNAACEETPIFGSVAVQKLDGETMTATPRAGSTLAGAVIGIINESDGPVFVNGTRYEHGDEVATIATNENGYAETSDGFLPYGTYALYEKAAPTGYVLNSEWNPVVEVRSAQKYTIEGNDALVETPVSGGISVSKVDSAIGSAQGNGSLAGAKFAVINENDYSVKVNGEEIEPQSTVAIIETNADGVASTGNILPYGNYSVKELEAPAGYALNQEWTSGILSIRTNGQTADAGTCPDEIVRGGLSVQKTDSQLNTETPYGDASFEGVVFDVYNNSGAPVVVNGTEYAVGAKVASITTNASGFATTGENVLPYGEYRVVESSVPAASGYALNEAYEATVTISGSTVVAADPCANEAGLFGGISVHKVDAENNSSVAQGDASLAGATFEVINSSASPVIIDGITYNVGDIVTEITTNASGVATSAANLPMGTYTIKEKTPSEGYTLNDTWSRTAMIRTNEEVVVSSGDDACEETPVRGSIAVQKKTSDSVPSASTSVAGAVISITNVSDAPVVVNGTSYAPGEVVTTITTGADGYAKTAEGLLPYGSYALAEVEAPRGYGINLDWNPTIEIRDASEYVLEGDEALIDDVARSDIYFVKADGITMERLPNIPFRVTNIETGESHIVVTDANGIFDSSAAERIFDSPASEVSSNINANDNAIDPESGEIDETKLDSSAAVWFYGNGDVVSESKSAFPYGNYVFEELQTSTNSQYEMVSFQVEVTEDGRKLDLGTVDNYPLPYVVTELRDTDTNEHVSSPIESVTLHDKVSYYALRTDKTYEIHGILVDQETGEPVIVNGSEVTAETGAFRPINDTGFKNLQYTFNATGMDGKTLVSVVSLYENGVEIFNDRDLSNMEETVYFPSIATKASAADGSKVIASAANAVVTDTVYYTNLVPNMTYTVKGTLVDKATGTAPVDESGAVVRITAETSFQPTEASGSVDVIFTFDATKLNGYTLVAFETLSRNSVAICRHADVSDIDQTVMIPTISTVLTGNTGSHFTFAEEETTLTDTVQYSALEGGKTYTLIGTLMDKATGAKAVDAEGNEITATNEFVANNSGSGSVELAFSFNGSNLGGKALVAFEEVSLNGIIVATHCDLSDENQTVTFPTISTTAVTPEGDKEAIASTSVTIIDRIQYAGLLPNVEYTVHGTLMDKASGEPILDGSGNAVEKTISLVPSSSSGTVSMSFTIDASTLAGTTAVVFEDIQLVGKIVAKHYDIESESQSVSFPEIATTAHDGNENHDILAGSSATIVDTVTYSNLIVGKEYTLNGTIKDKATGHDVIGANGQSISATAKFTPLSSSGSVDVVFTFDASGMSGKSLVAAETLINASGHIVAVHSDMSDADQTIFFPAIETELTSEASNHITKNSGTISLTDVVRYENLIPGNSYTVNGTLMNRATGEAVEENGLVVTASSTFTPEEANGSVELIFTVDASLLEGSVVVAFETISNNTGIVAEHKDIDDDAQAVWIPKIRTNAFGSNEDKEIFATANTVINDTVAYWALVPGMSYTVTGKLMDKATNTVAKDASGNEIVKAVTFTPDSADGSVNITFSADMTNLAGHTLVVFESVEIDGVVVAEHSDWNDASQTVTIPQIWTSAHSEEGSQEMLANGTITIVDEVSYENLIPGRTYSVYGTLMDKASNTAITDKSGNAITAEAQFTAENASGTVDVRFTFDASDLKNKTLVAFENLSNEISLVSTHANIDDQAQTIRFPKIDTSLVTGSETHVVPNSSSVTLTDKVSYENLTAGNTYRVEGVLMDKETGAAVVTESGNKIFASQEFIAEAASGSVNLTFTFDSSAISGKTVVAFEELYNAYGIIATHKDINSEAQSAYIPAISTFFASYGGVKEFLATGSLTLVDSVTYSGLLPSETKDYKLVATLMDKETNTVLTDSNGQPITTQLTFAANESAGQINVIFTLTDCAQYNGQVVVAFESLYYKDELVATHNDIEDLAQSVMFPRISTVLTTPEGTHVSLPYTIDSEGKISSLTLTDEVTYENLIPGNTYVIVGTLMDKNTGKAITTSNGRDTLTVTKVFVPEASNGTISLEFVISKDDYSIDNLYGTTAVAFETLYRSSKLDGNKIAEHANLTDEDQSVHFPKIQTLALSENDTHIATMDSDTVSVEIYDTVTYTNLVPGKTYKAYGVLMDSETGDALLDSNDKEITGETEFIPEGVNGTVTVSFTVDAKAALGKRVVVFEVLMLGEEVVATHTDLTDAEQMVVFPTVSRGYKYDATDHHGLAGAQFLITDKGLTDSAESVPLLDQQIVISGENGYFSYYTLPGHQYSIREIKAPDGYTISEAEYIVDINDDGSVTGNIDIPNINKTPGTVIITKVDAITGDPLEGCAISVFKVTDEKSGARELVFTQYTDKRGRIYFFTEEKGTYVFKETATIDGYYLNTEEYTFTIHDDLTVSGETRITNVPYGTVVIRKLTTEGQPLAGAQLAFYNANGTYYGQGVSDAKGRIYFVSPGVGDYFFSEVKAPEGYELDTNRYYFRVGYDYKVSGTVSLTNKRSDSPYSKTGDTQNLGPWMLLACVSMLGAGGTVFALIRKKRKAHKA